MSRINPRFAVWLCALATMLLAVSLWSLSVGAARISPASLWAAFLDPADQSREAVIFWAVRLPRLGVALVVGAALATAGAIMQAVTGNPLADPGLLGVNAGAAFAVVLATVIHGPGLAMGVAIWLAFAGAALASALVYALGTMGRAAGSPLRLVLAGVVVGTFQGTISMALLILDTQALDAVRLWTAGSLHGRALADLIPVLPYIAAGLAVALVTRDQFTTLSLGGATAQSLGQSSGLWRALAALIVVALAGASVALAGPLGFVGLVVPHMARLCVGASYARILPVCALGGALLVILADTLPRALWANDIPVGISLAVLGAPFFIWLARRQVGHAL